MAGSIAAALACSRFPAAGTAVSCAVSGGADSLALLVLATHADLQVTAVHVDHGIRPDSGLDADVVRDAAERFGAVFRSETVEVTPGPDLEARARAERHRVLPPGCLLAHTMDDQAETVLLALLRGTGLDGLAGIGPDRHPLLALRRSDTEAVCAEAGLEPVHDPSNCDPRFRRNRIRHEVLPLLGDVGDRDPVPLLARLAASVRIDRDHLDELAAAVPVVDAAALAATPRSVARRAVRQWLRPLSPERHPPTAATVERVLAVAAGDAVGTEVGAGYAVRRRHGRLVLLPPDPAK